MDSLEVSSIQFTISMLLTTSALSMMNGPSKVDPAEQETAGIMMVCKNHLFNLKIT